MEAVPIGIIGGSGLYDFEGLEVLDEVFVDTPYGQPSDAILITKYEGRRVAFLPRHGRGHRYNPTNVPYRANLWALKTLGVFWCVTVSATGSLREEIVPGHFVIPDQIIDRTFKRANTFFDDIAVHAGFSYPFDPVLRAVLINACKSTQDVVFHDGGTYVCMEGPLFSTKAESALHRSWGASLIGMTAVPEAKLAREAEMAYATIALATDYDVWNEDDHVSVERVTETLQRSIKRVQDVLKTVIATVPLGAEAESTASKALENAIMTAPKYIDDEMWTRLELLISKYVTR